MNTDPRMKYFDDMSRTEQAEAIRRMAADGASDYAIAHATRLSAEAIRRIIGEGARSRAAICVSLTGAAS